MIILKKFLDESRLVSKEDVQVVINKAKNKEGLNHKDVAILLQLEDKDQLDSVYKNCGRDKRIYLWKENSYVCSFVC